MTDAIMKRNTTIECYRLLRPRQILRFRMATLPKESDLDNGTLGRSRENGTSDLESRKTMIVSDNDSNSRPGSDRDPKAAGSDRTGTTADANQTAVTKTNRPSRKTFAKTVTPTKRRRRRNELSSRNCFFVDRNHQMLVLYGPSYKEFVSQAPAQKSSPTKPRNKPA
mmetsp:Transcript_6482/g.18583  ORF Transcript_6482/g.18583 Transcript_6482/m.18583 type:complete len:167 (+) Transcript_6482:542-1042(+)